MGNDLELPSRTEQSNPSEQVWSEFLTMLDTLAPSARAAFMLCDIFGASYEDASTLIGVPLNTCKEQVEAARASAHEHARSLRAQKRLS